MKFTLDILQDQAHMTLFPDFVKPYVLLLLQDLVPADTRLTHCHATSLAGAWSSCARQSVLQMVHILKPIYRIIEDDTIRDPQMGKSHPLF